MARTTSAALVAALMATVPAGATLAQTATDSTTPPAAAPAPATPAATDAAKDTTTAPASTDAAPAATDGAAAPADNAAATPAPAAAPATEGTAPATPAADGAAAAPATPATPAPAGGESTAAPSGEPQVGGYYTKSEHNDWLLRCMKTPDGKDPCELYQLLKDDKGSPVAEVSVIPFTGNAAAIMNLVAPLETDLSTGIGLQIDSGKNNAYPFLVCAPIGCVARLGMTEAELAALKKGSKGTVSLLPFGGTAASNTVKLNLSLSGFTAGFEELKKVIPAAPAGAAAPAAPAAPAN